MKTLLILLVCFPLLLNAQKILTAEDAIKLGLENNFDIRIARNNAEISRNNIGLGKAGFLPILDLAGNYQYNHSEQETNSPFSFGNSETDLYGGQITLGWTLFDGFKMFVDNKKYHQLAELGEAQARNIIEVNVVAILMAYFNLVQQEELLEVARSTLEISETRLNKEKVRRDVGGASSTDLLNAQVSYNNDRTSLINQELRVMVGLKDLNILLGQDPETPLKVEREIRIRPLALSYNEFRQLAAQKNSVLIVAQKNKQISGENVKIAKSNFLPKLFLNGSYGYIDRTVSSTSPRFNEEIETQSKDVVLGLTLNWNLFNGFRNKIDLQNARIVSKNQQLEYENVQNQIAGLVREKYDTFKKRLELLTLEEQNIIAAEQNLQLQADRYQIGTATSLEFRDAQVNLARAQISLIIARYQTRISRLEIEQLVGNIEIY